MLKWVLRTLQGPSFGQTRRSSLQELIDAFEGQRCLEDVPISRQKQRENHESVVMKRDAGPSQNHRD